MKFEFKKDILFQKLKDGILSGHYPAGTRFPPELQFAKELGVSFQTLRSALGMLQTANLVVRIPGKGTFVQEPAAAQEKEAKTREKNILVLFPDYAGEAKPLSFFNRELLLGLLDGSYQKDYNILPGNQKDDTENLLVRFQNGEYAGIIWDRPEKEKRDTIKILRDHKIPQIIINRQTEGVPSVSCDYESSLRQAGRFLKNIGHNRILLVDFLPTRASYMKRLQTLREIFVYDNIRNPEELVVSLPIGPGVWFELAKIWKRSTPTLTAFIVSNRHFTTFQKFIDESQLNVPKDLSVIIWGENEHFNHKTDSPYTILTEPRELVGVKAFEIILQSINGLPIPEEPIKIAGELIMRKGCSLPRTTKGKD